MTISNQFKAVLLVASIVIVGYSPIMSSQSSERQSESIVEESEVVVNGVALSTVMVDLLRYNGIDVQDGRYWYDPMTGAWGVEGEPTYGFLMAHLDLGGPLQEDASAGDTGVYINGRELPYQDVVALQRLVQVQQGRYWVDAYGNAGYEGGPALCNLVRLSEQSNSSFYRNSYTGIGAGSSGGTSYVMGKDWSVIVD